MPLYTDPDFPVDDGSVDAFNGCEAERDYWRGHARAIETDTKPGDLLASRRARDEAQRRMEAIVPRFSEGYRNAHRDSIRNALAGA